MPDRSIRNTEKTMANSGLPVRDGRRGRVMPQF